jgi:amino acid adenylation domain-containing protein
VKSLKDTLERLPPEKLRALASLLGTTKKAATQVIGRVDPQQTIFPLSFSQERLWLFEQIFPGTAVYTWPFAWPMNHSISDDTVRMTLDALVARHEILRTTYRLIDNVPKQCVNPPLPAHVLFHDFSALDDPRAEVRSHMIDYARVPFDLERGPLCRFYFFRTGKSSSVLAGVMHHSIVDAGSRQSLVEDMSRFMSLLNENKSPVLPALPIQYGDYATWQRSRFAAEHDSSALEYWARQLNGIQKISFPADRARPDRATFACGVEPLELPAPLAETLRGFSRSCGVSLFNTLLSGFLALISRYCGARDVASAIPTAGRNSSELDKLLGFFVNTLIIRTRLDDSLSFSTLAKQVKNTVLEALTHQDIPFERVVEALRPPRELNRNPFSDFIFQLESVDRSASASMHEVGITAEFTAFDVDIHLYDEQGAIEGDPPLRLYGTLVYNRDVFDAESIRRFANAYIAWLREAVAAPDIPIRLLNTLDRDDALQQDAWNATQRVFSEEQSYLRAISRFGVSQPGAIALECDGITLTYDQLNHQSDLFATYLRSRDIGRESAVAVCVHRSTKMVVALLGILKAHATYIPLNPDFPVERLRMALDDASPSLVITEREIASSISIDQHPTICIEEEWKHIQRWDGVLKDGAHFGPRKGDLAYRIYTSGSTGRPKSVNISHGALCNVIHSIAEHCCIDDTDVWLAITSISFDIAALEIFLPLTVGARCILATERDATDPSRIQHLIASRFVSVMQATPATWQLMTAENFQPGLRPLKILCGGEALPLHLAQQLMERSSWVWNVYGPTESTIWSSIHRLHEDNEVVPIGRPLANTRLYVLDEHLNRLPIGAEGDLFIAGDGLAQGYARRPALTAASFVPDPFAKSSGERMYRTGDRAKYRRDGTLVYLGRRDDQTKIRGFRIELSEIEDSMSRHPAVLQAAVRVWKGEGSVDHLIGYFTRRDVGTPVTGEALRAFIAQTLAPYMVPAAFIELQYWPLTSNGKIDRAALPPASPSYFVARPYEAPVGPTEVVLEQIWRQLLSKPRIGRHDNFFDLGGDSLASVQLVYLAKERGLALRTSDIFQFQTLESLAAALDSALKGLKDDRLAQTIVPLGAPRSERAAADTLFLIHPAGGDVMCYHELALGLASHCPVVGIAYGGFKHGPGAAVTVEQIATWYLTAIREQFGTNPTLLGGWSFGGTVAFEMARQLYAAGASPHRLLVIDQPAPTIETSRTADAKTSLLEIARKFELFSGRSVYIKDIITGSLPYDAIVDAILHRMKAAGMFPDYMTPAAFRDFLAWYDSHIRASNAYRPEPYEGALTVLRASSPSPAGIFSSCSYPERTLGWQGYCRQFVRTLDVPGHHLTVLSASHAKALANQITEALSS